VSECRLGQFHRTRPSVEADAKLLEDIVELPLALLSDLKQHFFDSQAQDGMLVPTHPV
jgi:hypothetical protein